jgi:hypothetical protein
MKDEVLTDEMRNMLVIRPKRNPSVEWEEEDGTGLVTVIYQKNFSSFERALGKVLKPVEELRRPLDEPGSDIWRLCDGEHHIASICTEIDTKYKERMEPVLKRVVTFIEALASRGLIILERDEDEA